MRVYFIFLLVVSVSRELLFNGRMMSIALGLGKMKCEFRAAIRPRTVQPLAKLFEI